MVIQSTENHPNAKQTIGFDRRLRRLRRWSCRSGQQKKIKESLTIWCMWEICLRRWCVAHIVSATRPIAPTDRSYPICICKNQFTRARAHRWSLTSDRRFVHWRKLIELHRRARSAQTLLLCHFGYDRFQRNYCHVSTIKPSRKLAEFLIIFFSFFSFVLSFFAFLVKRFWRNWLSVFDFSRVIAFRASRTAKKFQLEASLERMGINSIFIHRAIETDHSVCYAKWFNSIINNDVGCNGIDGFENC